MATIDPTTQRTLLLARSRSAYERGRVVHALRAAWLALPMVAFSMTLAERPQLSLGAGALLIILTLALRYRGGPTGRAVMPALIAGLVPLLLPMLMRAGGPCCIAGACWPVCMIGCILGGVTAGLMIGFASVLERESRGAFLIAATLISGLAGVLGCSIVGAAGMAGMLLAVIAAAWPVAMLARARA
jgi:hypothetical protein